MFKIANTINELVVILLNLKHYLECSVCQFMIVRIYLNESVGTLQHILSDNPTDPAPGPDHDLSKIADHRLLVDITMIWDHG